MSWHKISGLLYLVGYLTSINLLQAQQAVLEEPKGITHRALVRTPAASNIKVKTRIKDIADFSGIRENQLVGYGLVVGLNGTGDTLASSPHTKESLTGMLERLGVNIRDNGLPSGKNVAAVMVTAKLPPFAKSGAKIDIRVSAMGDAKDLRGGILLVTPLLGADGDVYAVAQGSVFTSGIAAQGRATNVTTGTPTSGSIANGAIIEKEMAFTLTSMSKQTLSLRNPDFTTAKRVSKAINECFQQNIATAIDNVNIEINLPHNTKLIDLITTIEQLEVEPDQSARIIIDPNGVIVMGKNVRISQVAVTHGSVTIRVVEAPHVSQPNPFTQVVNPNAQNNLWNNANANNFPKQLAELQQSQSKTLQDLVQQNEQHLAQLRTDKANTPDVIKSYEKLYTQQQHDMQLSHQQKIHQLEMEHKQNLDRNQKMLEQNQNVLQQATVVDYTKLNVQEEKGKFAIIDQGVELEELVNTLNVLGITPREMAQILHSMKAAGALHAEIIVL